MKHNNIILILLSFFFLSSLVFASAQDENLQNRQRVRENIITLKWLRLTQALDLSEEQASKIFPVINRVEKEKLDIQKQISVVIKDLRLWLKEKAQKEGEIEDKLKILKELRLKIRQKDEELEEHLEGNLTTVQRAKYVLFSVEFYRGLEEKLDRARMMRNRGLQKQ